MAQILPDTAIKKLLDRAIMGTDESFLNPNGIELRLGKRVRFHSTDERLDIEEGAYLCVRPGESVTICSHEKFDFSQEIMDELFDGRHIVGLVTPTTTMMLEGISQLTTKIDSGFRGRLDWSLRNSSFKDLKIKRGEPIYKLTLFLLNDDEEIPETLYGQRKNDKYQDGDGVQKSSRQIDADIGTLVTSKEYDPNQALEEAGPPFTLITKKFSDLERKIIYAGGKVAALIVFVTAIALGLFDRTDWGISVLATLWGVGILVPLFIGLFLIRGRS